MSSDSTMADEALACARRGWPVFFCHSVSNEGFCTCGDESCGHIGKHPRTKHGFKDATTDETIILEWCRKWPVANVAVPTGEEGAETS